MVHRDAFHQDDICIQRINNSQYIIYVKCVYSMAAFTQLTNWQNMYRKISNISRTKSKNLNDSRLVLPLSLLNPLKAGDKERMNM